MPYFRAPSIWGDGGDCAVLAGQRKLRSSECQRAKQAAPRRVPRYHQGPSPFTQCRIILLMGVALDLRVFLRVAFGYVR